MRPFIIVLAVLINGCAAETTVKQSISMMLMNQDAPFVTRDFAERLAKLVLEEKYKNGFVPGDVVSAEEKGECWFITFSNASTNHNSVHATQLGVQIRRSNGEIVDIY